MFSSNPLILLQQTLDRASTPEQHAAAMAVVEENDRELNEILWSVDHGQFFDDEFGTPFLLLATSMGNKWIWNELSEFGYGPHSQVYVGYSHRDDPQEAKWIREWKDWTLAGWLCCNGSSERVQELVDRKWLNPWYDPMTENRLMSAATAGLAFGGCEVADVMIALGNNIDINDREVGFFHSYSFVARHAKTVLETYPDAHEAHTEINRRLDALSDVMLAQLFPDTPVSQLFDKVLQHGASKLRHYDAWEQLYRRLLAQHGNREWTGQEMTHLLQQERVMEWAALSHHAPVEHILAGRDALLTLMVQSACNDDDGIIAWNAWCRTCQQHAPQMWERLPPAARSGLSLVRELDKKSPARERVILGIEVSDCETGARAKRKM